MKNKPSSHSELIKKARRVYQEPELDADEMPELRAKNILRAVENSSTPTTGTWKVIELSSWAGVGAAASIAALTLLTTAAPEDDASATSPWLDMPNFEEISL